MSKKNKIGSKVLAIAAMFLLLLAPISAYQDGDEDLDPTNQQNIDGSTIPDDQTVTGDIDVNGWIGVYDGDTDPNVPQPPEDGNAWINVSIPKTVLFGSLATDNGRVYGPVYTITNNSVKKVAVSTSSFNEITVSIPGVSDQLDLNIETGAVTLPLLQKDSKFLGTDFAGSSLGVIDPAANNILTFTLSGQFHGTYPEIGTPALPKYKLVLQFKTEL